MEIKKVNFYFSTYLFVLFFFGLFFLYIKHNVGNDTSISEWLINYQGGFVRRGIIGEISFHIANFFDLRLRFVIFLFQSATYGIYLFLIYNFFKNYIKNIFFLFAVFTPIFLLYPVAEIESLGRKEIFLFIYFLIFLNLLGKKKPDIVLNSYVLFIFPITCLIYEEVILFAPFILAALLLNSNNNNFISVLKLSSLFIPSFFIVFYFLFFPLSSDGHHLMKESLMIKFDEECYMSCSMLVSSDINFSNFKVLLQNIWVESPLNHIIYIFRYSLIFFIGFFPLHLLSTYSKFNNSFYFIFTFNKLIYLLFFLYIPILLIFIFGGDWGRWINITCTFATLFYFYLYKNRIIYTNFESIKNKLKFFENRKKILIIIFIIFAFGWNPQTLFKGDVSSFPGYRIPYKVVKWLL